MTLMPCKSTYNNHCILSELQNKKIMDMVFRYLVMYNMYFFKGAEDIKTETF